MFSCGHTEEYGSWTEIVIPNRSNIRGAQCFESDNWVFAYTRYAAFEKHEFVRGSGQRLRFVRHTDEYVYLRFTELPIPYLISCELAHDYQH